MLHPAPPAATPTDGPRPADPARDLPRARRMLRAIGLAGVTCEYEDAVVLDAAGSRAATPAIRLDRFLFVPDASLDHGYRLHWRHPEALRHAPWQRDRHDTRGRLIHMIHAALTRLLWVRLNHDALDHGESTYRSSDKPPPWCTKA